MHWHYVYPHTTGLHASNWKIIIGYIPLHVCAEIDIMELAAGQIQHTIYDILRVRTKKDQQLGAQEALVFLPSSTLLCLQPHVTLFRNFRISIINEFGRKLLKSTKLWFGWGCSGVLLTCSVTCDGVRWRCMSALIHNLHFSIIIIAIFKPAKLTWRWEATYMRRVAVPVCCHIRC